MNDWLKDGFETGYISKDDSAAGQLKKLEEKRIDEIRQYVAYQQSKNDRKERQAVIFHGKPKTSIQSGRKRAEKCAKKTRFKLNRVSQRVV